MFFDNQKYFDFVDKCRAVGINVPIIPGIKPVKRLAQLPVLAKTFRVDIPSDFVCELEKCKTEAEQELCGIEWCTMQAKDLIAHNVPSIHFYAINASNSVAAVAKNCY